LIDDGDHVKCTDAWWLVTGLITCQQLLKQTVALFFVQKPALFRVKRLSEQRAHPFLPI